MANRGEIVSSKKFHEPALEAIGCVIEGAQGMASDTKTSTTVTLRSSRQDNLSTASQSDVCARIILSAGSAGIREESC